MVRRGVETEPEEYERKEKKDKRETEIDLCSAWNINS